MIEKLWGDNFFNAKKNKWQTESEVEGSTEPLARGFCAFVLDPIIKLANAVLNGKKDVYEPLIKNILHFQSNFKFTKNLISELKLSLLY